MENKEQRDQIPEAPGRESQDEKTSQTENQKVEAAQEESTEIPGKVESEDKVTEPESKNENQPDQEKAQKDTPEEEVKETPPEEQPEAKNPETAEEKPVAEDSQEPSYEGTEKPVETSGEEKTEETPAATKKSGEETAEEEQKPAAETEEPVEKNDEKPAAETEDSTEQDEDEEEEDETHTEEEEDMVIDYDQLSRTELIEKLQELVQSEDITKIKSKVALIKVAFLKKSKEEKEADYQKQLEDSDGQDEQAIKQDELDNRFNELFDIYKQKRAIYLENLEKEKVENLKKKQEILEQLKELISSEETLKKTYDDFRELQEKWRNIGMVPKSEVNNLWQSYHFLVEKFFDKVKINKELKDLDLKKNLEQKIELCEKAEELLLETSIIKSFKQLQRYHQQWKEIGPVPEDKNEEIWERFKSTTDKINQRRRDHYKQLQEEQEKNLDAKSALCEKAEKLLTEEVNSIREWQEKTKQFNELFKVWKTIGPAPKKHNDEIWERFKGTLDTFFADKKAFFGKLKEQQTDNYNLKLDLCVQAEAMKDSTDWRNTTRDLINLQKEWKKIGPVPRKHSDKIWARFRAACDHFFNRKSEYFANIRKDEAENQKKKEALIKEVEEYKFDGAKNENLSVLKNFQRQWTEIGHVPFKEKDRLQNEFRNAINKQLDNLNISSSEMTLANYKSKMEVIKDTPEGNRQLGKERNFIQNKLNKLREDIMLWENNIGFLADTKKATVLKNEFEKKIEKAKNEVEVLESKLKILRQ